MIPKCLCMWHSNLQTYEAGLDVLGISHVSGLRNSLVSKRYTSIYLLRILICVIFNATQGSLMHATRLGQIVGLNVFLLQYNFSKFFRVFGRSLSCTCMLDQNMVDVSTRKSSGSHLCFSEESLFI